MKSPRKKFRKAEDPEKKLHRHAQTELLLTERDALERMRQVVEDHKNLLLARLNDAQDDLDAIAAIRKTADELEDEFHDAVYESCQDARDGANDQFMKELAVIGIILYLLRSDDDTKDKLAAESASRSFTASWTQAAIAAVMVAEEEERQLPSIVEEYVDKLDYRVRRLATTEVSRAWNDELLDDQKQLRDSGEGEGYRLFNRWDATLDAKTCAYCSKMHGAIVPVGQLFDGDWPGYSHVNCRCIATLITLAADAAA